MTRTPGYIIPSTFPSMDAAVKRLHEIDKAAGYTSLDEDLLHSDVEAILESIVERG